MPFPVDPPSLSALVKGGYESQTAGTTITVANSDDFGDDAVTDIVLGTSGNIAYSNTQTMHGVNSLAFTGATTATSVNYDGLSDSTAFTARVYLYLTAYPSTEAQGFLGVRTSGNVGVMRLQTTTAGLVKIMDTAGTQVAITTTPLTLNAWNRLEIQGSGGNSSAGVLAVPTVLGDSTTPTNSLSASAVTLSGAFRKLIVGRPSSASATTFYVDDPAFQTGTNTPLGPNLPPLPAGSVSGATTAGGTVTGAVSAYPVLVGSQVAGSTASNATAVTTSAFTPAVGDIIVVKMVAESSVYVFNAPTDTQGNTYTRRTTGPGGSNVASEIWTAIASAATSNTVTAGAGSSSPGFHSVCVERWRNATLAGTPATNATKNGTGAPSTTLTSVQANSIVTWFNGDWAATAPGTRAYRSSATEEGIHDKSTANYVAYYAYQNAPSAGSQTFGLTAPTGQTWTLAGIEIQSAGGGGALTGSVSGATTAGGTVTGQVGTAGTVTGTTSTTGTVTGAVGTSRTVAGNTADASTVTAQVGTGPGLVNGSTTAGGVTTEAVGTVGVASGATTAAGSLSSVVGTAGQTSGATTAGGTVTGAVQVGPGSVTGATTAGGTVAGSVISGTGTSGTTTANGTVQGTVGVVGAASGATIAGGTVTGAVGTSRTASGATTAGGSVVAAVGLSSGVTGSTTAASTVTGSTVAGTGTSGTTSATGTVTGAVGTISQTSGAITAASTVTGQTNLASTASGATLAAGTVAGTVTAGSTSPVTGTTTASGTVAGLVAAQGQVSGATTAGLVSVGRLGLQAGASGPVTAGGILSGTVAGSRQVSGTITAGGTVIGLVQAAIPTTGNTGFATAGASPGPATRSAVYTGLTAVASSLNTAYAGQGSGS